MEKAYLLFDVGGTQIKTGVADERGRINGEITSFPSLAQAGEEEIFDHFSMIIRKLRRQAEGSAVSGIGFAFPGPFDYEKGISLMKGLNKYDSIYGISIEAEIKKRVEEAAGIGFHFLHDVEAFALGESRFGAAKSDYKLLCLCIGTGAGSAFIEGGKLQKEGKCGVPNNGWLYDTPYKDSVIDDYLSVRGLAKLSREIMGEALDGKALYERCVCGDKDAIRVYRSFGSELTGCILPFVDAFRPDAVVFGGQISGSFSYFGGAFEEECRMRGIKIYLEPETSLRAMQGLFTAMEQEG